jgi:hypothetical protein
LRHNFKPLHMQFTFRCILDVEEDVIRDIAISGNASLEQFHEAIRDAFGMKKGEMSSFYRTDDDWEQGEEIPLFDMSEAGIKSEMRDHKVSSMFTRKDDKIIFVYDFMALWTFFVYVHEIKETEKDESTKVILSIGKMPAKSKEKKFKSNTPATEAEEGSSRSEWDDEDDDSDDDDNDDEGEDYGYEDDFGDDD